MQFSINIQGDRELKRALRGYNQKIRKGLQQEVARTATDIHRDAKGDAPVDTGILRNKINFVIQDLAATVFSGAKYSSDVEAGQKPGRWPNPQDIRKWVERKLGVARNRSKSVAFLVARKIFKKGTPAQPYFGPAVKKNQKEFFKNVKRMVARSRL